MGVLQRLVGMALLGACALAAAPGDAQAALERLLSLQLDGAQCYRVRDLFLEREDVKLYFTDGYLLFAEPFAGREVAALFLTTEPGDTGELLVAPPTPRERQSLALHLGETVLNERFRSALMLFTDDTAEALRAELSRSPSSKLDAEAGPGLAERWSPVLRNLISGVSLRMLADLLGDVPPESGVFAAAINGGLLGRFDVVIDPHLSEQVSIGKGQRREGETLYDTWTQFEARTIRQGRRQKRRVNGALERYEIEARLDEQLAIEAVVEADLIPQRDAGRAFAFELSGQLRLSALMVNGEPADFVQLEQRTAGTARRQNDVVLLALEERPDPDAPLRLRFEYAGPVGNRVGEGVYFVANRGDWYPRGVASFADYRITFEHPASLDLAATGRLVQESVEGDRRLAVYQSENPLRMAGFNLGDFATATRAVDGFTVEVMANENIEDRLKPKPGPPTLAPDILISRQRRPLVSRTVIQSVGAAPPSPAVRLEALADADAEAFNYFLERFGPPPTKKVIISAIPAGFGQGFPGLVYAATLSFYSTEDAPLANLSPRDQMFFTDMLRPHELAHQWWGNSVTVQDPAEGWLMEALANYSALLNIERSKGPDAARTVLAQFQEELLEENEEGFTIESAGPVTLGERLKSARFPDAYRLVMYGKGAWILHMLRTRLGDEGFFELLAGVADDYRLKEITTELFREEAAKRLPEGSRDPELRNFFEQWAYRTGVPRLRVRFNQERADEGFQIEGRLLQSEVGPAFSVPVELELQLDQGAPVRTTVWTEGDETRFQMRVPAKVRRIEIDPDRRLLAVRGDET